MMPVTLSHESDASVHVHTGVTFYTLDILVLMPNSRTSVLPFSRMSAKAFFDPGEPVAAPSSSDPPPSEAHTRVAEFLACTPVMFSCVSLLINSNILVTRLYYLATKKGL